MPSPDTPARKDKKDFISQYKIDRGCSVCGYNKCSAALEFDHIDRSQKKFNLSAGFRHSWKKIHEELEKCVVLCSNCHREKTTREKDYREVDFEEPEDLQLDLL